MREIKFRGFSIGKKKWVYGNYNYTFERGYLSQGYDDVPPRCYYIDTETNYYEVYSQSIGQYTGLKDRNGKEIYEGDIVKVHKGKYVVEYWTGQLLVSWFLKSTTSGDTEYMEMACIGESEVIGNIYENPELLKSLQ